MTHLDPAYVLAPLQQLLADCHSNVVMGLRIVEQIDVFPPPTTEELQFAQLSFEGSPESLVTSRNRFKTWILLNGFEDVHTAIRHALERFVVLKTIQQRIDAGAKTDLIGQESELRADVSKMHYPQLLDEVDSLFTTNFTYRPHAESYNAARNCLQHTNGIVTERHCNDGNKSWLVVRGNRFKLFFKKGDEEVPAVLGQAGPENAAFMLGAEEFQIQFKVGQRIELSLKQFLDVLNTCIFIRTELAEELGRQ